MTSMDGGGERVGTGGDGVPPRTPRQRRPNVTFLDLPPEEPTDSSTWNADNDLKEALTPLTPKVVRFDQSARSPHHHLKKLQHADHSAGSTPQWLNRMGWALLLFLMVGLVVLMSWKLVADTTPSRPVKKSPEEAAVPTTAPAPSPGQQGGNGVDSAALSGRERGEERRMICTGTCCSAPSSRHISSEEASTLTLPSSWWSRDLLDGAQIQLKSARLGKWVGPDPTFPGWSRLGVFKASVSEQAYFIVDRIGQSQLRIRTKSGSYMALQVPDGTIDAVEKAPIPATEFTIISDPAVDDGVLLQAYDGSYVAIHPVQGTLIATQEARNAEVFRVREVTAVTPFRGVSLSNWLVAEAWMRPDLFIRVPVYLDGLQFRLQSIYTKAFISVESTGGAEHGSLSCIKQTAGPWETFHMRTSMTDLDEHEIRTLNHSYWSLGGGGKIRGDISQPTGLGRENFRFHFHPSEVNMVMIEAPDGNLLTVSDDDVLTASTPISSVDLTLGSRFWSGSTVFLFVKTSGVRGEWQFGRHFGEDVAMAMLDDHRYDWVTEEDFKYLKKVEVNAIKVPVGYWITEGEGADYPYTKGGIKHLDFAFDMAEKYNMRVFLSMHGAPGSQNGYEHSGSRDGIPDWASSEENIERTIVAVEWLAKRYSKKSTFAGIGLLNEPLSDGVPLEALKGYYKEAYNSVRKHSKCAFVSIMARVGEEATELENFMIEDEFTNVILDEHFYNIFDRTTGGSNFEKNVKYVEQTRSEEIAQVQKSGRPFLVGEWSLAILGHQNITDAQMEIFANKQLEVYGEAKAGWFFFSHKMGRAHWPRFSFMESVENGWLKPKDGVGWY